MFERIIVITKKTALEELLTRHHSRSQVRFFLERRGDSIEEYDAADRCYREAREAVLRSLPSELPREIVPREHLPNFLFRETDLVLALGPDGLAVNAIKYLSGQPLFAINPDPARIDGVLMRHRPEDLPRLLKSLLRGDFRTDAVTLAEARTNDGQTLYAVNDFLVGRRDQISARYTIAYHGKRERQSSSGVLVATGVGSTGWISSVFAGARAIAAGGTTPLIPLAWDSRFLLFTVREPFSSRATGAKTVIGKIEEGDALVITSEMPEGGVIFSDGVPEDAIEFNSGATVTIRVAERRGQLVTPLGRG